MDPWRLATRAQRRINVLAGTALASCVLAWLAGFGSASSRKHRRGFHRERRREVNRGTPRTDAHRKHRAHQPCRRRSSWQAPPSVTSMWRRPPYPCLEKATDMTAAWISEIFCRGIAAGFVASVTARGVHRWRSASTPVRRRRKSPTRRQAWMSRSLLSWPRPIRRRYSRLKHPLSWRRACPAGRQHPRNQRGMSGRGDLHRSVSVGALRTGAQDRRHQGV